MDATSMDHLQQHHRDCLSESGAQPSEPGCRKANAAVSGQRSDMPHVAHPSQFEHLQCQSPCSCSEGDHDHAQLGSCDQPGSNAASGATNAFQQSSLSGIEVANEDFALDERAVQSATSLGNDVEVRVGLRPYTVGGVPLVGPLPGLPRVLVAAGHEGSGLTLGPATAELVLHHLYSRSNDTGNHDLSILSPETALANDSVTSSRA